MNEASAAPPTNTHGQRTGASICQTKHFAIATFDEMEAEKEPEELAKATPGDKESGSGPIPESFSEIMEAKIESM